MRLSTQRVGIQVTLSPLYRAPQRPGSTALPKIGRDLRNRLSVPTLKLKGSPSPLDATTLTAGRFAGAQLLGPERRCNPINAGVRRQGRGDGLRPANQTGTIQQRGARKIISTGDDQGKKLPKGRKLREAAKGFTDVKTLARTQATGRKHVSATQRWGTHKMDATQANIQGRP